MRKFILKGLLFCTIIFLVCSLLTILSTKEPTRSMIARWTNSEDFMSPSGMLPIFEMARAQDDTTQLVTGDSICRQMFTGTEQYNPKMCMTASNAALMITGQYLVAEEYLRNHPDATDVFLIMHPLTIARTFDMEWSYRYAVMTYVETDTLQYLDDNTRSAMVDVYGNIFLQKPVVELIEESPMIQKVALSYLNLNKEPYEQSSTFEIADQYIKKMYDLCEEKEITLHFYSSPVAEYYRGQMKELEEEYRNTWMYSQYPNYFSDILYYPTEWAEDLSHFSGEYAEREELNEIIRQAYEGTELVEKIRLE